MENEKKSDSSLKAIDILEALKDGGKTGLGITEVSEKTGLSVSTVHRIISALTKREYVIKDENTKKYNLSFKVLQFGRALLANMEVTELIHPYLEELSNKTGEAVHLMQQAGTQCVFVDKVDSPHPIGLKTYIGKQTYLHCSAGGKIILAYKSKEERERIFDAAGLPQLTQNTIAERRIIEYEIETILAEGFSWNRMEDREDVIGIAAPIFDVTGKVLYAVSIVGPSYRFTLDKARQFASLLKITAMEISEKLGYFKNE